MDKESNIVFYTQRDDFSLQKELERINLSELRGVAED